MLSDYDTYFPQSLPKGFRVEDQLALPFTFLQDSFMDPAMTNNTSTFLTQSSTSSLHVDQKKLAPTSSFLPESSMNPGWVNTAKLPFVTDSAESQSQSLHDKQNCPVPTWPLLQGSFMKPASVTKQNLFPISAESHNQGLIEYQKKLVPTQTRVPTPIRTQSLAEFRIYNKDKKKIGCTRTSKSESESLLDKEQTMLEETWPSIQESVIQSKRLNVEKKLQSRQSTFLQGSIITQMPLLLRPETPNPGAWQRIKKRLVSPDNKKVREDQ